MIHTATFHKEVFLPASASTPVFSNCQLKYSKHSIAEANKDRYGKIQLPQSISYTLEDIIESQIQTDTDTDETKIIKQVVRKKYDEKRDIVLVIAAGGFVKTTWFNMSSDKHSSLKANAYERV